MARFINKCIFLAFILQLGLGPVIIEVESTKHLIMMQSFTNTVQDFLEKNECTKEEEDAAGELLKKIEEINQGLNATCTHDEWQSLIQPIYVSLHKPDEVAEICEKIKTLTKTLTDSPLMLNNLCFSQTHVLQCGKATESEMCECLSAESFTGVKRNRTGKSVRRAHDAHSHHTDTHTTHDHSKDQSSNTDECKIAKNCQGSGGCYKSGSGRRAEFSVAGFLFLIVLGFFMV